MPLNSITPDKLLRLVGTPHCPTVIDIRGPAGGALAAAVPGTIFRDEAAVVDWARRFEERETIVVCADGGSASAGAAALLRHHGCDSRVLAGGFEGWTEKGYPTIDQSKVPRRSLEDASVWVTRARPKVDRIVCPWLIRRFIDPEAVFLYVNATEVVSVAERHSGAPFDLDGAFWSHRGEECTFDTMVAEFGLASIEPLANLAAIVRGADTARPDLAPQAAGLVAMSLGLSRMYSDDLEQLEAGMLLYDALYRWSRDAMDEIHDWVSHRPRRRAPSVEDGE